MSDGIDWDEFRLVRAIAETQSLYGAAARLGLNHSTMFRRLTALETRLGLKLFERDRSGYRPTAAGEDMAALAALMGETIAEFERRVGGQGLQLTGQVRLNTVETIGHIVAPELIAGFRERYPGVQVDLCISEAPLDLVLGDADVALRVLRSPPSEDMTARRVAACPWAVYAAPSVAGPREEDQMAAAPWVALSPAVGPPQAHRWIARHVDASRIAARSSSVMALADFAARGLGVALLPRLVGASRPGLAEVGDAGGEADGEIWLVAAPQALRKARVRALYDYLAETIERRRGWLEGEAPAD